MSANQEIKPAFSRVEQSCDHDCALAVLATLSGKTLAEVRRVAEEKFGLPKHGPYWIDENLIAKLSAHLGWTSTVWKESTGNASLPDIAIALVDFDAEREWCRPGRCVLFTRQRPPGKPPIESVIDVSYWATPDQYVRTDIKGHLLSISWYIGLTQMNQPAKK